MLDTGWVMLWDDDRQEWVERARHCRSDNEGEQDRRPSVRFLNQIRELKRTSWKTPEQGGMDSARSLIRGAVKAAVAAPLVDTAGEVIGALYGDRRDDASGPATFTKLEALLVELLAGSVAAGLARLTKEEQVKKAENQLEFILGKDLAAEVTPEPRPRDPGREVGDHRPVRRHPQLQRDQPVARPQADVRVDQRGHAAALRVRPPPRRAWSSTTSATP